MATHLGVRLTGKEIRAEIDLGIDERLTTLFLHSGAGAADDISWIPRREVLDWCAEELGPHEVIQYYGRPILLLTSDEDAVKFKLRWF